jgi:hypothetical protein
LLGARIVEPAETAVARQRPVNNDETVFSVGSAPAMTSLEAVFSIWSVQRLHKEARWPMTMTNDRPDLPSEGAPDIDKTILINVNRNKYPVVRPSWALKPGLTD